MRIPRIGRIALAGALATAVMTVLAPPASAQATRTWVSGVGDDVNPCSRTAPCKTWAGAISKTAVGGTINAMDDGGFGSLTITKSVTIDGGGHIASALTNFGNGINVNATAASDVVLRNIDITGIKTADACMAVSGVNVVNARSVRLDNVEISGFQQAVSTPLTSSSADMFVDLSFNDLDVYNNCSYGLRIAPAVGHPARATIDGTTVTGSNVALSVGAGAEAWVSDSKFYLNNLGVQAAGGPIHSLCNNSIAGNASPGAFTDESRCSVATVRPPAAYCSVPKLQGRTVAKATTLLTKAGCKLGKVTKKTAPTAKRKLVLTQAIPAKVQVKRGTKVPVVVGK